MKVSVLATSSENLSSLDQLKTFSGKQAGICYMKDKYFDSYVSDDTKALKRYNRIIPTGHHSIADHAQITLLFENIPKITAMILNSLNMYTTSEKSGRYTVMNTEDGLTNTYLYNKWLGIIKRLILNVYPDFDYNQDGTEDETLRTKLAQENARYFISVFDPCTTMGYTVSLRQLNYIYHWCLRYIKSDIERTPFNDKLRDCISNLADGLMSTGYIYDFEDNKHRCFNFLSKQTGYGIENAAESYSESYLIKYKTSFVDLAQEQRHRTIDYFMAYDGTEKFDCYVPPILSAFPEYAEEWVSDMVSIKDTFPCGTKVTVVETGSITNFMLKCDERLCGRVQLETMQTCINNLYKFERSVHKSDFMRQELEKHFRDGRVIMKCGNIKCKEPCRWGALSALNRLI